MKPVITILFIALWCSVSAQQDTFYHWPLAYGDTILPGEHIQLVSGDNVKIVDQDGNIVIETGPFEATPGDRAFYLPLLPKDLIIDVLFLYDAYLHERPTRSVHIPGFDPYRDKFLKDCELEQITHREGINVWFTWECHNKDHYQQEPINASFEGFIKWLRQQ